MYIIIAMGTPVQFVLALDPQTRCARNGLLHSHKDSVVRGYLGTECSIFPEQQLPYPHYQVYTYFTIIAISERVNSIMNVLLLSPSACLSVCLSACMSGCLCLPACLSLSLHVCLYVCMSVCLSLARALFVCVVSPFMFLCCVLRPGDLDRHRRIRVLRRLRTVQEAAHGLWDLRTSMSGG